jgi:acyl transferase domain-containing protein
MDGVECVRFSSLAELDQAGVDKEISRAANYVPASAILEDSFLFDADLFGMSKIEAALIDPQHRYLLSGAWEAMEGAGYLGAESPLGTSYYCGVYMPTYFPNLLAGMYVSLVWSYQSLVWSHQSFVWSY